MTGGGQATSAMYRSVRAEAELLGEAVDVLAAAVGAVNAVLDNVAADVAAGRLHPDAAAVVARVRAALPDDPSRKDR